MKLIPFLIIVLIVYFVVIQIMNAHNKTRYEKYNRSIIKHMEPFKPIKKKSMNIPSKREKVNKTINFNCLKKKIKKQDFDNEWMTINRSDVPSMGKTGIYLLNKIKDTYLDSQYYFNDATLPVTSRSPNKNTARIDKKYLHHIKQNINNWNESFDQYGQAFVVKDIKPIFIQETENEFVIQSNVMIYYKYHMIYLDLTFYGQIERSDDFLNGGSDIYIIQLVSAKLVSESKYHSAVKKYQPFLSMEENMKYVDRINKMHADEANEISDL